MGKSLMKSLLESPILEYEFTVDSRLTSIFYAKDKRGSDSNMSVK